MQREVEFLKDLVLRASKLITSDVQVNVKDDKGDLVTNFDYEIETFINKEIKENYPTFDIVSEEFNSNNTLSKNCFTVDPIDGTINFAHRMPLWGIQVACVKNGKTIAAVIFLPKLDELYWADKTGCYLNDKKIHVNNLPISKNLYTIDGPGRQPSQIRMKKFSPQCRDTYCCAVDYAWVASGVFGGTILRKDSYWDYIPGQYLVKQAGGYIYNSNGCHIASNNKEFGDILEKYAKVIENDFVNAKEI